MAVMGIFEELEWRGFIHQVTAEELGAKLNTESLTLYVGYDPTGASLHVGHLTPIILMKHLQRAGHRVIALVGGGTAMIGDPSGKSAERNLQDRATIEANGRSIHAQLSQVFVSDGGLAPAFRDNYEWLGKLGLIEFLRDTAKHFSVNAMVHKDSVKSRFEREGDGISFTEFSYSLLQARDFLELYRLEGCTLQLGGSDQWGNIVAGIDLIRRVEGVSAYGLTVPLLTDAAGSKFGKTEKGAVFLSPGLTSPYAFYQFWVNTPDEQVETLLKRFTFLDRARIEELVAAIGSPERTAQKALAEAVTTLIHGADETARAIKASQALFSGAVAELPVATLNEIFAEVPAIDVERDRVTDGVPLVDLLAESGACSSKSDARRQIAQGAICVNDVKASDAERVVTPTDFLEGQVLVIRRGKRQYALVKLV
jgi:tyrosyl-tRNA synthetase